MIFQQDAIEAIKRREKTQTRRPVHWTLLHTIVPCRYVVGRAYSLQPGRGRKGEGLITILTTQLERLDKISDADVKAEGFATRELFAARWLKLHGPPDPVMPPFVWVIGFAAGDWREQCDRVRLLARPGSHLEQREGEKTIARTRVNAKGQLEARGHTKQGSPETVATSASDGDYTAQPRLALAQEPEAISDADQLRYTLLAKVRLDADDRADAQRVRAGIVRDWEELRALARQYPDLRSTADQMKRLLDDLDRKLRAA